MGRRDDANGEGEDAASEANRKKTIEQMQQRKRKVEEDPNDYKRKEKKAPQLTQKERETLALERLKKKREGIIIILKI